MEIMGTLHFFIIVIFLVARIASIDATCPYDRIARCSVIGTAKRFQSGQPEEGDSNASSSEDRSDAYKLNGTKWDKYHITYKIIEYSRKLDDDVVDEAVRRAFKLWSDASNLTFEKIPHSSSRSADIRIEFVSKIRDGVAGESGGPYYSGNLLLGDNINWSVDKTWGTNLREVVAHELGHALGISHSDKFDSIMYAEDRKNYDPYCGLDEDDIQAIQELYGKPGSKPSAPRSSSPKPRSSSNSTRRLGPRIGGWFSGHRRVPPPPPSSSSSSSSSSAAARAPSDSSSSDSSSSDEPRRGAPSGRVQESSSSSSSSEISSFSSSSSSSSSD